MLFRIIHIIVLIVFLGYGTSIGQNSFASGAELLQEGRIDDAIGQMKELIESGQSSKELYSNMGYAYFQKEDLGNAMLYYHKALKLDPRDRNTLETIQTIRDQLEITITEIPDFVLVTTYRNIVNRVTASSWSILQLITGILAVGSLGVFLFPVTQYSQRAIKCLGFTSLILCILFGIFSFSKKQMELSLSAGIVMQPSRNIHVSPDDISPVVAPVSSGNLVYILSELGEWYKVSLRDKDVGWIKKEEVAII